MHFTTYLPHPKPPLSQQVPLRLLVVLRDYLLLIYLVLWFFTLFWVIFEVKIAEVDAELSPRISMLNYRPLTRSFKVLCSVSGANRLLARRVGVYIFDTYFRDFWCERKFCTRFYCYSNQKQELFQ